MKQINQKIFEEITPKKHLLDVNSIELLNPQSPSYPMGSKSDVTGLY